MRRAALAQFGWQCDEAADRWIPTAPWKISEGDANLPWVRPRRCLGGTKTVTDTESLGTREHRFFSGPCYTVVLTARSDNVPGRTRVASLGTCTAQANFEGGDGSAGEVTGVSQLDYGARYSVDGADTHNSSGSVRLGSGKTINY